LNPRNRVGERGDVTTRPDRSQIWQSPGLTFRIKPIFTRASAPIERVVVIGPAHYIAVRRIASPMVDAFETPLGRLPVDHDSLAAITDLSFVVSADGPHAPEHALEVELPFLQTLLKPFAVVPHRKMWLTFFAGSGAGRKR
jgi:hypothetical protein